MGGYFNGGNTDVFGSGASGQPAQTAQGRYGFYVVGDQALLRWGDPAEKRHLGVFAAFTCAPDRRVNSMPCFFNTGLVAYGFLPERPRDFAGLALACGTYSADLRRAERAAAATGSAVGVQSFEMTVELTYGCTVKPGLLLQPSLPYIVNPGGDRRVHNAVAVGLNAVFSF